MTRKGTGFGNMHSRKDIYIYPDKNNFRKYTETAHT